jgi:hypothetical protein
MPQLLHAAQIAGSLGDIFWDLSSPVSYTAGDQIPCKIYVKNVTANPLEYMLMVKISRGTTTLTEFAVPVDGYAWFNTNPGELLELPAEIKSEYSDAAITLELYTRGIVTPVDTIAATIMTPATGLVPGTPGTGIANTDLMSLMIFILVMVMMNKMMNQISDNEKKRGKEAEYGYG